MAYLDRISIDDSRPIAAVAGSEFAASALALAPSSPDFSALEWSVIRLAHGDRLSTLREPGLLRRFTNWLTGIETSTALANPRLEALRRMAVLSWHHGFVVPGADIAEFSAAGFSEEQYELMVSSIRSAITNSAKRIR